MNKTTKHAKQLAEKLVKTACRLVTAESCTGGGLAEILTRLPGSSVWFERGYVTYSNESKQELLSVPLKILEQFGAVSEETATAMATGALANSHADYSVAITGIAGPGGGTENKPVGTVCFGWGKRNETAITKCVFLEGSRLEIRAQSCLFAMQELLKLLKNDPA